MKTLIYEIYLFGRCLAVLVAEVSAATLPVLIIDGQNNHDYRSTTPHLKKLLEQTGLFSVDVATTPARGGDLSKFRPEFAKYRVIVSNYNGDMWSQERKTRSLSLCEAEAVL